MLEKITQALSSYDGLELSFMEVCGTHTAAIMKNGIPSILSPKIHLISGPGCPVCVTVASYIDRLVELSLQEDTVVCSFGDLLRVPGSHGSLSDAKARGGHVQMVYAPFEMLSLAKKNPQRIYVFAAVGFETTTPVYALLIEEAIRNNLKNVKLLTALKTMPEVVDAILQDKETKIDGFLAPGHVCAVTGAQLFTPLATKYEVPFVVSGFTGEQILCSLYLLLNLKGQGVVKNLYREVVKDEGNPSAQEIVAKYMCKSDAAWRGLGVLADSGMKLREEYRDFDAGSEGLVEDVVPKGCRCAEVLVGKCTPLSCPMYGTACTPENPYGGCMVSQEGTCFHHYRAGFRRTE